jgi:hypothetical protein
MKRRYFCATLAALLTTLAASGASHAQDSFTSHPIRILNLPMAKARGF